MAAVAATPKAQDLTRRNYRLGKKTNRMARLHQDAFIAVMMLGLHGRSALQFIPAAAHAATSDSKWAEV